ncbi:MAG TPA: cytochrome P450 [Streptosporangiaceae bacterium]|nr:cytochrome P450 [Streptosporangiaceae bacterium]
MPEVTDIPTLPFPRAPLWDMPPGYRDVLDSGKILKVRTPNGDPAWLISRYEHVRQLFMEGDLVRSHPDPQNAPRYSPDVFAAPVGDHRTYKEDHARIRRVLTAAFNAKRMQAFRPRIEAIVDGLLDDLAEAGPPQDFREHFALPIPVMVITELLGVPVELRDDMQRWSDQAQNTVDGDRAFKALLSINDCFIELVQQRQRQPADDILSELTQVYDEKGKLTFDELIRIAHTLLFSGFTSSVARIEFGTVLLLNHPAELAALRADPGIAPKVVEEILRIAMPSFGAIPRWAGADIEVGGQTIRAGDLVLLGHEIANRDPERFAEPDKFDIHRTDTAHLAFGHGAYFCIGSVLSRLELQVVFSRLFGRLPGLRLAVAPEQLRLRTDSLIGGFERMPVAW